MGAQSQWLCFRCCAMGRLLRLHVHIFWKFHFIQLHPRHETLFMINSPLKTKRIKLNNVWLRVIGDFCECRSRRTCPTEHECICVSALYVQVLTSLSVYIMKINILISCFLISCIFVIFLHIYYHPVASALTAGCDSAAQIDHLFLCLSDATFAVCYLLHYWVLCAELEAMPH